MNRIITLAFHEDYPDIIANTRQQAQACIGYLATWAISSERYSGPLTIYGDKDGNLHATYRDKAGEVTYNIFGQRSETGDYSTHS